MTDPNVPLVDDGMFAAMAANAPMIPPIDDPMGGYPGAYPPNPLHTITPMDGPPSASSVPLSEPSKRGTMQTQLVGRDTFTFAGVTYQLGPIVSKIKADFEQFCEDEEAAGIERMRGRVSTQFYVELRDDFMRGLNDHKWAWDNGESAYKRSRDAGKKQLFLLILRHWNSTLTLGPASPDRPHPPYPTLELINAIFTDQGKKWEELETRIRRLDDPNPLAQKEGEDAG